MSPRLERTVLVFARRPERGKVKTRLARVVGDDAALALHRAFLADTLEAAQRAAANVVLAHTAGPDFDEARLADHCIVQRGSSFGDRVDAALSDTRALHPVGPLMILGMDTPHLSPAAIERALDALTDTLAVIGPSTAGGFYLFGLAQRVVSIAGAFNGPNEAARLARLLRAEGLAARIFDSLFDVDVPSDLAGLIAHLELLEAAGAEWIPPASVRAIDALGLRVEAGDDTRAQRLVVPRRA